MHFMTKSIVHVSSLIFASLLILCVMYYHYLKSYYHSRKQYVYSNGFSSESSSVVCGVPQRSILGPICFSLYINDMPFAVKVDVVLFADDAAFIITCPTLEGLFEKIKELFHDLSAYLNMKRLIPNSKKCNLMMFNSCPTPVLPGFSFMVKKFNGLMNLSI